jgi:protein-S-isoprenylcysteine O-methyltransferase Ste14
MTPQRPPLGAGWVIAQIILFMLILAAPVVEGSVAPTVLAVPLGLLIGGFGLLFALLGITALGRSLSIFPRPTPDGDLVRGGVYRLVRHPIYTGVILAAVGWSVVTWSALAFAGAALLFIFFDRKSAFEEKLLEAKFADYGEYKRLVKKLIPGVY